MPFQDPVASGRIGGHRGAITKASPEYHLRKIRELVDDSRRAQGLPETITDALVLAKVVALLRSMGGVDDAA